MKLVETSDFFFSKNHTHSDLRDKWKKESAASNCSEKETKVKSCPAALWQHREHCLLHIVQTGIAQSKIPLAAIYVEEVRDDCGWQIVQEWPF